MTRKFACPFCLTYGRHIPVGKSKDNPINKNKAVIFACMSCDRYILGVIDSLGNFTMYPKAEFYIHSSFPKKVKELIKALYSTSNPNITVMCARVILEYTLKDLGIGTDNDPLYERIQKAYEKKLITKPVADWAHIVRKFGNVAIHDVEATYIEAAEVKEFIKIFLDLVYRIPYEISKFEK